MPQPPLPPALQSMPPRETLPTMYDLPSEDPEEPGLPDEFHDIQPQLLRETCQSPIVAAETLFFGTDLNLYYDWRHPLWHKRPDWFLVIGVNLATRQEELRRSYVIWQEQVTPFLVIELLSPGTEDDDLGRTARGDYQPPTKWEVYEQILQIPYYGVFDSPVETLRERYDNHFRLFRLHEGCYEPVELMEPRFWFPELGLGLGVWQGAYLGVEGLWLRWYDGEGHWVPTPMERSVADRLRAELADQLAEQEHIRAEQEQERAEQERIRAEQERERAEQAHQQAEQERERAEQAHQQAEQERERAEQAHQQAEQERERAEQAHQQAEQERIRAEQERIRAEQANQQAEQERIRAEQERERAEQLAARLRALGIDPEA